MCLCVCVCVCVRVKQKKGETQNSSSVPGAPTHPCISLTCKGDAFLARAIARYDAEASASGTLAGDQTETGLVK